MSKRLTSRPLNMKKRARVDKVQPTPIDVYGAKSPDCDTTRMGSVIPFKRSTSFRPTQACRHATMPSHCQTPNAKFHAQANQYGGNVLTRLINKGMMPTDCTAEEEETPTLTPDIMKKKSIKVDDSKSRRSCRTAPSLLEKNQT